MNPGQPKLKIWVFLLVAGLYVLHQDFWNWNDVEPLVFGILPIGLAYHVAYSLVTALVMWALVKWAWPGHLISAISSGENRSSQLQSAGNNPKQVCNFEIEGRHKQRTGNFSDGRKEELPPGGCA
jgi:hypothetical protein